LLVDAGRALDFAVAQYQLTRPALARAVEAWRDALAQLPRAASDGLAGEADTS